WALVQALVDFNPSEAPSADQCLSELRDSTRGTIHEQVHRVMDSIQRVREFEAELLATRSVRARIATKWAEQLRSQGDSPALQVALNLVTRALAELDRCPRWLLASRTADPQMAYMFVYIRTSTLATLGEIELDLGDHRQALEHLRGARRSIDELIQ